MQIKMPAWWGRKSHRPKDDTLTLTSDPNLKINDSDSSSKKKSPRSSDESARGSNFFRNGKDLGGSGGGGFSGFDSVGHPLPRPSNSSSGVVDHGVGPSGSASVSSNSSHGSNSDELPPLDHHLFGIPSSRARSPGPASRSSTSPLHPRLASTNLESPPGRPDEGRNQAHPLPLPPSSPSSPSLPNGRVGHHSESTHNALSKWKKGKLLGRGTFGHVYLGFNRQWNLPVFFLTLYYWRTGYTYEGGIHRPFKL